MQDIVSSDRDRVFQTPLLIKLLCFWVSSVTSDNVGLIRGKGDIFSVYHKVLGDLVPESRFMKIEVKDDDKDGILCFWIKWLDELACLPATFERGQLYKARPQKLSEVYDIMHLGLVEKYKTNQLTMRYRFKHFSFRDYFHARWWTKQPKEDIVKHFAKDGLLEFEDGFHSALSLRFFCDLLAQTESNDRNNKELLAELGSAVSGRAGEQNDKYLSSRLIQLDQGSLLRAVCESLEGPAHDDFVMGVGPEMKLSPLMVAAFNGSLSCLNVLLDHGVSANGVSRKGGHTAISLAAERGHFACVLALLANGGLVDGKALLKAAMYGKPQIAKFLVRECHADVNYEVQLGKSKSTMTSLKWAAYHGDLDLCNFLLENGATDVNEALHTAAGNDRFDVMKKLVEKGADIQSLDEDEDARSLKN